MPSILTPLQRDWLQVFFKRSASQAFFLTGGTALAEFYLQHRHSEAIDLFTLDRDALEAMGIDIPAIDEELGSKWTAGAGAADFRPIFVERPGEPRLKIDLVREVRPQFGEHQQIDNVIVDSKLNIAVNKVTALFGRGAVRDFVDLYFLAKQGFDIYELMDLAKEKGLGFTEFYFSGMVNEIRKAKSLPNVIKPVTLEELRSFFLPLAEQIMLKTKPRD